MCTESAFSDLPLPAYQPEVFYKTEEQWLKLLREAGNGIEIGMISSHPITKTQITQTRTAENRYETHYLFYSPDADILVKFPGRTVSVPPGSIMWFPPGIPYMLYLDGEQAERKLHRFRFKVFENGILTSPWTQAEIFHGCIWFPDLLDAIEREQVMPDPYSAEQARMLLVQFSIRLFRLKKEDRRQDRSLTPSQIRTLYAYMIRNVRKRPAPADLAHVVKLSPAYFTKVFMKSTGISPRRWILEQRIRYSTQLLTNTPMNINEIAYWLGYDQPRLYTRQFRDTFGTSPTRYRKQR